MTTPIGTLIAERYRVERELGEGGMANVYVAQDLKHDRQVALKVLKPELAAALGAQRFLKEIQLTANLQHPHILPLFDSGNVDGALFYVMPLVKGESLRDRLTREKLLPVDETVRIITQVAGALDYAHRQGVIHRDIKPENILLQDGEALLADFGIALAVTEAGGDRLTGTGLSIGTMQYMSPEQASGERDVDARSDVYSLGAVAYEMLAGEAPVTGPTPRVIMAKLMTEPPTPLRVVRDVVPVALEGAVMRALAKEPTDRFAGARAFADALSASSAPAGSAADVSGGSAASGKRTRTIAIAAAAIIALGVIGAAWTGLIPWSSGNTIRSIAVLPLDNYSGDETQDYFAEGMTDELTSALATIGDLRVTSRGSAMQFAGKNRPPTPEIAKALGVDAIVEGSVARAGDRVRITANLIDARTDKHLWTQSFERNSGDVFTLQAELASAIAGEINVRLTPGEKSRLAKAQQVDPAAHDAYLRGRYFFNRPSDENLKKAIEQFEESVRLSPNFASAWSGLSDAYLWAGYNEGFITASAAKPKAREAAERAVQLDSMSVEAQTTLAIFMLFYEYDWVGMERTFRKAIALNPNYAYAHDQFGLGLAFIGRLDESVTHSSRAAELDPLSPQVLVDASMAYMFKKDFAGAKALAQRAGELDPSYFFPVMIEGWADMAAGKFKEAIGPLERAKTLGAPPFLSAYLAYAYGASGNKAGAQRQLAELKAMSLDGSVLPFNMALVYLGLGDHARAIEHLEQARAADSQMLGWLGHDPIFDRLRGEPRFQALLKALNF